MDNTPTNTQQDPQQNVPPTAPSNISVPKKQSLKLPIILMVWPIVAIIACIILYAIVNLLFSTASTGTNPEQLFGGSESIIRVIINISLFCTGAASVIAGPFSFIAGLVLLIMRLQNK